MARPAPSLGQHQPVPLEGLVTQPVVTPAEFEWAQQRRQHNQQFAATTPDLERFITGPDQVRTLREGA